MTDHIDEIEFMLTRTLIQYPEKLDELASYNPKYFSNDYMRRLNTIVYQLYKSGQPVNDMAMMAAMTSNKSLYLDFADRTIGMDVDVTGYWQEIKEHHFKTRLHHCFHKLSEDCQGRKPIDELLALARSYVENTDLRLQDCEDVQNLADVGRSTMTYVDDVHDARKADQFIRFGIGPLDDLTGGFWGEDVVVIGGRPSTGKTAIALYLCLTNLKTPGLFFSLEMSKEMLMIRLASARCGLSVFKASKGMLNMTEQGRVHDAIIALSKEMALRIYDGAADFEKIKAVAKKEYRRNKIKFVIIDYFTLIKTHSTEAQIEEYGDIMQGLINLRKELRIPIIVLSQLNRIGESRPSLATLRKSGSVEEAGDIVILLHNDGTGSDDVEAIVAKHRNGPTATVQLTFDKKCQRFDTVPF